MLYGPIVARALPKQDISKIRLIAQRFDRASAAHEKWAIPAKECVDFFEGRQWTAQQIAELQAANRPHLVLNEIAPLIRLIIGYHRNNKTDSTYLPGNDEAASEDIADILTELFKSEAETIGLEYVNGEVFLDGILSGRAFWDTRMDFETNDLGSITSCAVDPFRVRLDPDATDYDINKHSHITTTSFLSMQEIEDQYGKMAADHLSNLVDGRQTWSHYPDFGVYPHEEIAPETGFSEDENFGEGTDRWFRDFFHGEMLDPLEKRIRLIDHQYWVSYQGDVFIDLETGDRKPVPDLSETKLILKKPSATERDRKELINKLVLFAESNGNPIGIERRLIKRVRWCVLAGDTLVHDEWSPYDRFTMQGYFPYFRRGKTRGPVHDLIDPQREVNKRHNAQIEAVSKTSNGGWKYEEGSLDPENEDNLHQFGAAPGVIIKHKKGTRGPERMDSAPAPQALKMLEDTAVDKIKAIAGINESALGSLDRVQSGAAIDARQRQAVIGLQMYNDNFKRSKELVAANFLYLFQTQYTEQRMFRIMGENGKMVQKIINLEQFDPATGGLIKRFKNDITRGRYTIRISERPMSASFESAQFEEFGAMFEKLAPILGPNIVLLADMLVDMSSIPRKDEIKERINKVIAATAGPNFLNDPNVAALVGGPQGPQMPQPGQGGLPPQAQQQIAAQ